MNKFNVKFLREFEVQIEADTQEIAAALAGQVIAGFPKNADGSPSAKVLSIIAEGYVEKPCAACEAGTPAPTPPSGRPNGGGSPGTPVVKTETLVDQIAEAA